MQSTFLRNTTALVFSVGLSGQALGQEVHPIDIPSQPLADAIAELGHETGLYILAPQEAISDMKGKAVRGPMTAIQALRGLVAGSNLSVQTVSRNSVVVTQNFVSQNAGATPFDLGTIYVTGELLGRELLDTQTSAAVVTGEDLAKRADDDVYDVIERVPNVSSSFGEKGFVVRGVSQTGTAGRGLLVSTQVDGVALPTDRSTFFGPYSSWDLDQVEILRGPQSTQQGRNALAGAITIRSNDPDYEELYRAHAEYGSRNTQRYALTINQPLIDDRLALRFSADHFRTDGFVTNPTLNDDEYDAREETTYRAKLRWDASEDLELLFSYSHVDSSGGEDFVQEPRNGNNRFNYSNEPASEGSIHDLASIRAKWNLNESLTLESETSYYDQDYHRREDFDSSAAEAEFFDRTAKTTAYAQDLRLRFDTGRVNGVVGLFFTEIDNDEFTTATIDAGFRGSPVGIGLVQVESDIVSRTNERNIALYGEADIAADHWLTGLSFTIGARYDYERFEFNSGSVTTPTTPQIPDFNYSGSTSFNAFLPKLAVIYDFAEEQSVSFTYQRGYRAGGAQVNRARNRLNEYDPEFSNNYELAYRGSFQDGQLRILANAFYTEFEDQQVNVFGQLSTVDFDVVNAGKSEAYGAELTIAADPTENLSIFGSVGYVKTRFKNFVNNGDDLSGNRFPQAPEWSAAFSAVYRWDNGVSLGMDASYTGDSFTDSANSPNQLNDSRLLVNTQITYETGDGWLAGLYVRNLFDKDYATVRQPMNIVDPDTNAVVSRSFARTGEPRTVGVYLTKTF